MKSFLHLALALGLTAASSLAGAAQDGLAALGQFLAQTQSGSAAFTQTVAAPKSAAANQAQGRHKVSTGQFSFSRPNRFRFDYQKPYAQTIVADGKTLWFYDQDLAQVSASPQAQALHNTPAALLTNAHSLADLQKTFTLKKLSPAQVPPLSAAAGLVWVEATPKTAGSTVVSVKVGLAQTPAGVQLKMLDVLDSLGQRSVMEFGPMAAAAPASSFQFTPPKGVAVLQQ